MAKCRVSEVLDGIMERQLEAESAVNKIKSLDLNAKHQLDQIVIESKKADEEVWAALKQSMEDAARVYGWLAVQKHSTHSEVHELLKTRIAGRVAEGIREDQIKYVENMIVSKLPDSFMESRMRFVVRTVLCKDIRNIMSKISSPGGLDEMYKTASMLATMPDEGIAENAAGTLKEKMKYFEDLLAREFSPDARDAIKEIYHEAGDNIETMIDELPGRLHEMRMLVKTKMANRLHETLKADRMAADLIREEQEAKLTAERKAAKRAAKASSKAASNADSKAASNATSSSHAKEAINAARREAQRLENEDRAARQAIALVQAHEEAALATKARRAAKKAEKKARKVCESH